MNGHRLSATAPLIATALADEVVRQQSHIELIASENIVSRAVGDAADRLGVTRNTLSRVLNGKAGVSPRLAIALERLGWSDAGHWVRMPGAYELAQARRADSAA